MVIKNIKGGISIINIVIILSLILLAYLSYAQYLDKKVKQELSSSDYPPKPTAPGTNESTAPADSPINKHPASDKTAAKPSPTTETKPLIPAPAKKGYYKNNTYFYEISFPENWQIKIRSEENVSLGTIPPKNGQGAITIEIAGDESENEVKLAKAEAAKYPGLVSLTEESYILAGLTGAKITLNNFTAKTKNIYILLIKNRLNYIIKYSEESPEFSDQAEKALSTFKFLK